MRLCTTLVFLLAGFAVAQDKDKDKAAVREIPTKDLKVKFPEKPGKATEPAAVTSAEALGNNPVVGGAADEIKKQVNFDKEKLLVFAWAGSGQDMVAVTAAEKDKKTVLTVTYTPGKTRDLRQHVKLFAVPKDAELGK
jgi:hypothetical protein